MNFFVYIIYSVSLDRFYIGYTFDLEKRLSEHNRGISEYTSKASDWSLRYSEPCSSRELAMKREKEIKRKKSRTYIESLIKSAGENLTNKGWYFPIAIGIRIRGSSPLISTKLKTPGFLAGFYVYRSTTSKICRGKTTNKLDANPKKRKTAALKTRFIPRSGSMPDKIDRHDFYQFLKVSSFTILRIQLNP